MPSPTYGICPDCNVAPLKRRGAVRCRTCANKARGGSAAQSRAASAARQAQVFQAHLWRERFDELARQEMEHVALSEDEAAVVQHVVRGTHWDAANVSLLWSEVEEAIRMEGMKRWPFDVDSLIRRLRGLSPLQSLAVVVTFER